MLVRYDAYGDVKFSLLHRLINFLCTFVISNNGIRLRFIKTIADIPGRQAGGSRYNNIAAFDGCQITKPVSWHQRKLCVDNTALGKTIVAQEIKELIGALIYFTEGKTKLPGLTQPYQRIFIGILIYIQRFENVAHPVEVLRFLRLKLAKLCKFALGNILANFLIIRLNIHGKIA